MNFALRILKLYFPDSLKKRMLTELFDLTAQAFGVACPEIKSMSYGKTLKAYAVFTAGEAGRLSPNSPEWRAANERLYENARSLGTKLNKTLRLSDPQDILEMIRILYKMLGIDFAGLADGEVVIRRCFFSRFYGASVCRLISSLDEGIAAGLSDGGRLEFSGRITEGRDCCRGRFTLKGTGK